jgi:hypothetical protein
MESMEKLRCRMQIIIDKCADLSRTQGIIDKKGKGIYLSSN